MFIVYAAGEWTTTGGVEKEPFLIHDSGPDSCNRAVVYASERALKHLAQASTWFMDGTFSTAPKIFQQLYVIRAPIGESAVTCVYAFLSCKSQDMYEEMLRAVVDACERVAGFSPDSTTVIIDFEQAVMKAVPSVLGEHVLTNGCFYHLT